MSSATISDCGYDKSTNNLIGNVYYAIKSVRLNLSSTKRLFILSGYQCQQLASVCQVRNIFLEDQTNSFSLTFGQGVCSFDETSKSIQGVLRDFFFPGKPISWQLCNNSETHWHFWKVWSLVACSQSSFYATRTRKDDKNRQNTLFICLNKDELATRQTNVHFCPISMYQI